MSSMPGRRSVLRAAAGGLAALAAIRAARAEQPAPSAPVREIFLAHTQKQNSASNPTAAMAAEFKRQVEGLTEGRLKVGIFPAGQLGGNREIARLIGRNVVQTGFATIGGVAPAYPPLAITQIPFVPASAEAAQAVYDGPFGTMLAEGLERRTGMMVLGYGDGGGLSVGVNGQNVGAIRPTATNAIRYNTDKGVWQEQDVRFDAAVLKAGDNAITLTVPAGDLQSGVVWDYLRLELAESRPAGIPPVALSE